MDPLVSIVIPCHNAAPWVEAAVRSALEQTWPRTEVIVVDDGSTDDSLARIRRLAPPHALHIHSQPNQGASAARNAGLQRAQGDYIQFLDADDLLDPRKIEVQVARLQACPRGTIASGSWARFHHDPAAARFFIEPNCRDLSGLEFQLLHLEAGWMMHPAAWLCPRRLLEQVGPWDETLSLNDDGEYFSRVMLASQGIRFVDTARSYYRSGHRNSLSRRNDRRALESLYRSTGLVIERALASAGNSPRARQAAATGWRRVAFETYPGAPDLSRAAERHCLDLGGTSTPFPAGPAFQRVARWLGWRTAKRLRDVTMPWRAATRRAPGNVDA